MNQKDCGLRSGMKPILSFILVNALTMTGCATLGDIESANKQTQQSLYAFKKETRESQAELKKEVKALKKDIKGLKSTDQAIDKDYDKLIKENQKLRASLLGVTATLQGFLDAEKKRYEDGLRWIENANKAVGQKTAKPSGGKSLPKFPGAMKAPAQSPPPGKPAPASSSSPSPSPGKAAPTTSPAQPPDAGTPETVAVAGAASVAEEAPLELEEDEKPTIKIIEIMIDPPKVERKSKFTVTVKYDLKVTPDTPQLKYVERVILLRGTLSIQNLKEIVEREPGTISFSRTIEVPAEAPKGVYTIKGVVRGGPVRHSKIKTFIVK